MAKAKHVEQSAITMAANEPDPLLELGEEGAEKIGAYNPHELSDLEGKRFDDLKEWLTDTAETRPELSEFITEIFMRMPEKWPAPVIALQ